MSQSSAWQQRLALGLDTMGIDHTPEQLEACEAYADLLMQWNRAYNLTAVRDKEAVLNRHFLDSLSLLPGLGSAKSLLDVGTGAGFPGLPLAVFSPERQFVLLDSLGKRTRFLQHVKGVLGLAHVTVVCSRIQDFCHEAGFDIIMARAVASVDDLLQRCQHVARPDTRWALMQGVYPEDACAVLTERAYAFHVQSVSVPDLDAARHILWIEGGPCGKNHCDHESEGRGR